MHQGFPDAILHFPNIVQRRLVLVLVDTDQMNDYEKARFFDRNARHTFME